MLKDKGIDPEEVKEYKASVDLCKDQDGNVYVKTKDGSGPREPTGINLKVLE